MAKIVGVSDGHAAHDGLGDHVSASSSRPSYLDVTHPHAGKGRVVGVLSERYEIAPDEIAPIGDRPNDVLVLARAGPSVARGDAGHEVPRAAGRAPPRTTPTAWRAPSSAPSTDMPASDTTSRDTTTGNHAGLHAHGAMVSDTFSTSSTLPCRYARGADDG